MAKSPPTSEPDVATTRPHLQLWRVFVPQHVVALADHWRRLDADERERAAGFHREADRQRYVVSQGSLRALLGKQLGIEPTRLTFDRGAFGKPCLAAAHPTLHFNTSHSGDWIVHGVSTSTPLGVDVELVPPEPLDLRDYRQALTPQEFEQLHALPVALRNQAFISLWVRKEAYVKATGHGLSKAFSDISIEAIAGDAWTWHMLDVGPTHIGCLAYPGPPLAVQIRDCPAASEPNGPALSPPVPP